MRAIHFMKIDYTLTKKQIYSMPLFFILAAIMGAHTGAEETSFLVASTYMLFVSAILSTAPFSVCVGKSKGFLLLLPATVKERVAGRFLYGLSFMTMLVILSAFLAGVYRLLGYKMSPITLAIFLCALAIGIALTAVEFLFFYLFGEGKDNWQYLSNIVRVAPGMILFFAGNYFIGRLQDTDFLSGEIELEFTGKLMQIGAAAVAAALLLTAAAAGICTKVIERRDYA